jgi:hypothetical protein
MLYPPSVLLVLYDPMAENSRWRGPIICLSLAQD